MRDVSAHSTPGHPALETLALYAAGDLPIPARMRIRSHVNRCSECGHEVQFLQAAKAELKREARTEILTSFEAVADWELLEREMLGNIAVGVAAARCVDKVKRGRSMLWSAAFAAGLTVLFVLGWLTHIPAEQSEHLAGSLKRLVGLEKPAVYGTVVRSTPEGIAVRTEGVTLTIMHPPSAVISLSGSSAVSARYVDEETGEVTITKVYGQ